MSDVKGQQFAKHALEIAAAGNHNILMIGPPGTGKSMLASRLSTILPPLTLNESIETTKVHSVAGLLKPSQALITSRPFRAPHHSVTVAGLAGGGRVPKPGEISLAHNGVLFLDELPEFDKNVMEILRQPIEEKTVSITRVNGKTEFPCSFMLVAAMNPCKCGFYGHPTKQCTCSVNSRRMYVSKISGPLLDRIDIQVELRPLEFEQLSDTSVGEKSAEVFKRVTKAREFAKKRFENLSVGGVPVTSNGMMNGNMVRRFCVLDEKGTAVLKRAYESLGLSARGYDRLLKIARTVADFDESEVIGSSHIATAIQLRTLDRNYWD
jgi:magnesium chelatase family protein